jgi:predicted Zn-dependent protease
MCRPAPAPPRPSPRCNVTLRPLRSLVAIAAIGLLAAGCAHPAVRRPAPPRTFAQIQQRVLRLDGDIRRELGAVNDAALQKNLDDIGARLAAVLPRRSSPVVIRATWEFTLLDVAAANVFALPTGQIYVTRGLLPYLTDEDELAAIVAHEMAHVRAGHVRSAVEWEAPSTPPDFDGIFAPAVSRLRARGTGVPTIAPLFLVHTEEEEVAADRVAVEWLTAAGYSPLALGSVLAALDDLDVADDGRGVPTFAQTHGMQDSVIAQLGAAATSLSEHRPSPGASSGAYTQRLRGLAYGDDPREGYVRGNEFIHPFLRAAVTFPVDWDSHSGRGAAVAQSVEDQAFVLVTQVPGRPVGDGAAIAAPALRRAGLAPETGRNDTIGGRLAYVVSAAGTIPDLGAVRARAAFLRGEFGWIEIVGVASVDRFDELIARVETCIRSVRFLDAKENASLAPDHLELESIVEPTSWDAVARRHGGVVMGAELARLNRADIRAEITPGTKVRVVVTGRQD